MYRHKRLARLSLVAGSAVMLVTGVSTSAQAATGTFTYNRADTGFLRTMLNPPDEECIVMPGGGGVVNNITDTVATVFRDEGCSVPQDTLYPGNSGAYGGADVPHSVYFGQL
ncbi:hypothetical protein [Streptomyces spectabilis]|uniref:Uncharacterized protein n=2 Tax=Streptomyces spectabilis TaxID=68270 RepID=A0A7W8ETA2_STRST|nr:hypothetical protein [Streptomyces spectabilis]MBB5103316.1 hypothetical protein [Streptomyces spectabilis]MCI3902507.1 hypothetical protein [Streptomyces spectabilis]GGV54145.1 hypothetical protein GCM10010245_85510 [Streptomyces spectabilis]